MTVTAKNLVEGRSVPDVDTNVYAAPANTTTIIDKITSANYDTASRVITIGIVAAGNSVSDIYYIAKRTLAAKETYIWPEVVGQILNPGDYVTAIASQADTINLRISGREIT
jgi:hypothetical protein